MISKRKAFIGALIIILLTTTVNIIVGNLIAIPLGNKVIIHRDTYDAYEKIRKEFGKASILKDYLIENYYKELDEQMLIEGSIKGMFDSIGDPYTVYMNKKEFDELRTRTKGTYGGIGIIVTPGDDGYVLVVSPIEDTPGERAGIITGDRILSVDGESVSGDRLDYAVELMKGKPGTKVTLTILRENISEPFDITIRREEIRLKTVRSEVLEGNIGYIRISMFDEQTDNDFKQHLQDLRRKNIEGLIIDLRNNPGGLLTECINICDMILGEQVIVYTEDRDGTKEVEMSSKNYYDVPLVVLVNQGSASASEILAGAVRDGKRGTIIGTTTFGKGLVQQVKPLSDGTGFKITVSQYFTPNGINIHGKGIVPDIIVELPDEFQNGSIPPKHQDTQLKKALEILRNK